MKKLSAVLFFAAAFCVSAEVLPDIPYYEKGAPAQGNVEYRNQRCKLHLSTPDGVKNFPTIVYFHGGGLSAGSARADKFPAHFDRSKTAVAIANYRLSGKGGKCPDYIYDAAAAVAWVVKNIAKYGGDPKKVYVSGHSAGGYLTAMVALDKKYLNTFGVEPEQIAGYFPVSGQMTTHFRILAERREKDPSTPQFMVDEYAPVYHAKKGVPYMVFFVGDGKYDYPARVEENALLHARLTRIFGNENVKFVSIPFGTHSSCGPPSRAMINRMVTTGKML
jgi:poly(3-hydroxybutyrate) depolymerase